MIDQRFRPLKGREVTESRFLKMLENIEDSGAQPRAELPAPLPVPPDLISGEEDVLGEPLNIRQAARVIGCSAWTVRQKYLPLGLPHFRSGPRGKLIFYKTQVIHWLLERQRKGGLQR